MDVLVNQVGYKPQAVKRLMVQASGAESNQSGEFRLLRGREVAFAAQLQSAGSQWGRPLWMGDFTALQRPGLYQATATLAGAETSSPPFSIDTHAYDTALQLACRFFYYQRCGCEVAGWHAACHLDDGYIPDEDRHIDATGGWHSAGDYPKWGWESYTTYALACVSALGRNLPEPIRAQIMDEALWGGRYLLKMEAPQGGLYSFVREVKTHGAGHFVDPAVDTDNIIGTADDRLVEKDGYMSGVYREAAICKLGAVALAKLAAVAGADPLAPHFLNCAERLWSYSPERMDVYARAAQLAATVELYKTTGRSKYGEAAGSVVIQLLAALPQTRNFTWFEVTHAGLPHAALAMWLAECGAGAEHSMVADVRRELQTQFRLLQELSANPFGIPRFYYIDGSEMHYSWFMPRRLDRYCKKPENLRGYKGPLHNIHTGLNSYYGSLAWSALLIGRQLGAEAAGLALAQRYLDWILGVNPFALCMLHGAGAHNPIRYHTRMASIPGHEDGCIPGTVPNGIDRPLEEAATEAEDDVPFFDLAGNRGSAGFPSYHTTEMWLPNNLTVAMAMAELMSN